MPLTAEQDIRAAIGEDLWTLLQQYDSPIFEAYRLTTHFSDYLERGSYKVKLSDGRVFKARRFPKKEEAKNLSRLCPLLNKTCFPRVLVSYGKGVLIEWIEGRPLSSGECDIDIIGKAAVIQAELHHSEISQNMYNPSYSQAKFWRDLLDQKIVNLVEKRQITESEGMRLSNIARLNPDLSVTIGLTHGDYCPENMILSTNFSLKIIDIETISITALAHDLARTTIRWPMKPEYRQAYLQSYGKFLSVDEFFRNFSFWIILVLVESAIFFAQGRLPDVKKSVDKLREILEFSDEKDLLACYGY